MKVLITGGAGYVGSHTCKAIAAAGHEPVVFDNLSRGHADFVKWGPLEQGDLLDGEGVDFHRRYDPKSRSPETYRQSAATTK